MHAATQRVVDVDNLWKLYERPRKSEGVGGALRGFIHRQTEKVEALKGISFTLDEGETLGYIGPNGAGKTTTLKLLAGALYPSRGRLSVLGFTPIKRERAFLRQISFVMSGRGFLEEVAWDLSVLDGYHFLKEVYGLPKAQYQHDLEEITALLQIQSLLNVPLRQLSHGQRARAELASALLWRPRLLLLDEPTLGLDLLSQQALRDFVKGYVRRTGAACVVTSHYTRDIEALADRICLVNHGQLVLQGSLGDVMAQLADTRLIRVTFEQVVPEASLFSLGEVVAQDAAQVTLRVPHRQAKPVAQALFARFSVSDLTIEEPDLEEALRGYFAHEAAAEQGGAR
jgi:ABC-2 type transport system ATP-binding protein